MIHLSKEAEESRHPNEPTELLIYQLPYTSVSDDPTSDQDAQRLLVGEIDELERGHAYREHEQEGRNA